MPQQQPTFTLQNSLARDGYLYDSRPESRYTLEWSSPTDFANWLREEQQKSCIELRVREVLEAKPHLKHLWENKTVYVCGRAATGGHKKYQRKTDRKYKLESKKIKGGCPARLVVKTYPNTTHLRGCYSSSHSHDLLEANLVYTRVPDETRERVAALLRGGMTSDAVVSFLTSVNGSSNLCCRSLERSMVKGTRILPLRVHQQHHGNVMSL